MDKKTKFKFGFILFFALVIIISSINGFLKKDDEQEKDGFDDEPMELEQVKDLNIDEEWLNEIEENEAEADGDSGEVKEDLSEDNTGDSVSKGESSNEVEDYSSYYVDKHGKTVVEGLETKVEEITKLLFKDKVSKSDWLVYINKDVYESTIKEADGISLNKFKGESLDSYSISPVAHSGEDEIMFEVMIDWSYNSADEQVSLIYITYDVSNKDPIVSELVIV